MNSIKLQSVIEAYNPDTSAFKPFIVRFSMMTPVCLAHPWIHFDALIAHSILRKILGDNFYTLPSNLPINFFETLKLPLKKYRLSDLFIYHSSVSIFSENKIYSDKIYKRFETTKMKYLNPGRSTKIDMTRGRFKNYMITLPYLPCSEVSFYGNGDISEIKMLLKNLPGLGKKIAAGYGAFHKFTIKKIEADESIVNHEGRSMRPIPREFYRKDKGIEELLLTYKFPYWAKSNVKLCCNINQKIELKK